MTVHQYMREGNLLKPTKMCSLENGLWLLRYAGRPTPKMIKRWSRKTATNVKYWPRKLKGERWERERVYILGLRMMSRFRYKGDYSLDPKCYVACTSLFGSLVPESKQQLITGLYLCELALIRSLVKGSWCIIELSSWGEKASSHPRKQIEQKKIIR